MEIVELRFKPEPILAEYIRKISRELAREYKKAIRHGKKISIVGPIYRNVKKTYFSLAYIIATDDATLSDSKFRKAISEFLQKTYKLSTNKKEISNETDMCS